VDLNFKGKKKRAIRVRWLKNMEKDLPAAWRSTTHPNIEY